MYCLCLWQSNLIKIPSFTSVSLLLPYLTPLIEVCVFVHVCWGADEEESWSGTVCYRSLWWVWSWSHCELYCYKCVNLESQCPLLLKVAMFTHKRTHIACNCIQMYTYSLWNLQTDFSLLRDSTLLLFGLPSVLGSQAVLAAPRDWEAINDSFSASLTCSHNHVEANKPIGRDHRH